MVMKGQVVHDLCVGGAEPLARDPPDSDYMQGHVGPFDCDFRNMLWACQMYLELWIQTLL